MLYSMENLYSEVVSGLAELGSASKFNLPDGAPSANPRVAIGRAGGVWNYFYGFAKVGAQNLKT